MSPAELTMTNNVEATFTASPLATADAMTPPYAIYFGDVTKVGYAKTGLGLIEWRRDLCLAQIRREGVTVDGGLPDMSIAQAAAAGARSVVIGVASPGGEIPESWLADLIEAVRAGLDIVSGMHVQLSQFPGLVDAARRSGSRLIDIRKPPADLKVATGIKRSGRRLLTVGTDCAVGKKYTALAIEAEMKRRGWSADFRATGQTGIMIAGKGIPIDSVVSDFLAGAAERLSPNADSDHWDVIEGQGAISHPAYAGVTVGLLHGSQPDALILCHDPSRTTLLGFEDRPHYTVMPLDEMMELYLPLARRVNPNARFVGISLNTSRLDEVARTSARESASSLTGLPAVDPIIDGVGPILDLLAMEFVS